MNIFVGNLSREVSESDLKSFFAAYGQVASVALIGDPSPSVSTRVRKSQYSNRLSRAYAYVEMPDQKEAGVAISEADGKLIGGLPITVLQAMPIEKKKAKEAPRSSRHTAAARFGEAVHGGAERGQDSKR